MSRDRLIARLSELILTARWVQVREVQVAGGTKIEVFFGGSQLSCRAGRPESSPRPPDGWRCRDGFPKAA